MRIKLLIAVLIQMLLLLSIIAYKQYIIASGQRILLATRLIDPRDMLKGDYVRLSYDMSSINTSKFAVADVFKAADTIYVTLDKGATGTYSPLTFSKTAPQGATFIKGKVKAAYPMPTGTITVREDSGVKPGFDYYWPQYEKEGTRHLFCVNKEGRLMFHFIEGKGMTCGSGFTEIVGVVENVLRHENTQITAEYGIENFFVEAGKGRKIESALLRFGANAVVYLTKDGKAVVTNLIVNGKEIN
ncbi:MAG: GDYXXLXY domain-containing protein [Nitrospirae bacterium]|nr:GDYXXLXY domain-containing protein [Nitrospirota bacterium]